MSKKIVSIEELPEQDLIDITTSSRTFVANGLVSHNCLMFDEMAHMLVGTQGPRTADEVYNATTPALDELRKDGMIYVPTSPYTRIGKAYSLYENCLTMDDSGDPLYPDMLLIQLSSWEPYVDYDKEVNGGSIFISAPQLYDDSMKRLEQRDPDVFRVERKSQWAEVVNSYLSPVMVEKMFEPFMDNFGNTRVLEPQQFGVMQHIYRGHADPSASQANFAMCIAHAEAVPDDTGEEWYHVFLDYLYVWRPEDYEGHQIDYDEIEDDLSNIILRFPTMKVFSYDQYGAFVTVPRLKKVLREKKSKVIVKEETFTQQSNKRRNERFKSALGQQWIHSYRDDFGLDGSSLLETECKFLQIRNGRVDKQDIGPCTTKDLYDSVAVCVDQLLEDNFVRLEKRDRLGKATLRSGGLSGYSSRNIAPEDSENIRAKLGRFNRSKASATREYGAIRRLP